jgi:uncharacterized delta-60 repeat protein
MANHISKSIVVVLALASNGAYAKPGDLDPTFGNGGIVISDYSGRNMFGPAVRIQPDGKIVVAGKQFNGHDDDILVQRFLTDGSPDTSFGTSGATVIKLSAADDNAKALTFQNDGKIVLAGGAGQSGSYETSVLVRVSADGILDSGFGVGGKVLIDFGLPSHSHSVAIQSDGNIVVTGETYTTADGGLFATARVLPNGAFDTSFGTGGKVTQTMGSGANAHSLVLQSDGRILLGGYAALTDSGKAGFIVSRLLSNGTPDASFGSNGYTTVSVGEGNNYCHALMQQSDGKIILAGSAMTTTNYDFSLVRFNSDGMVDNSFGTNGIVTTNFVSGPRPSADETAAGVLEVDGRIVVGGYSERKFALARYLSNGTLDSSFGTGGLVSIAVGTDNDAWIKSMAQQSWDGKIVVVGYSKSGTNFNLSMARFSSDSVTNPGFSLSVSKGWNLLGNGINQDIPVTTLFGNSSWVDSVWAWNAAQRKWYFFSPAMAPTDLISYATSAGYGVLSSIEAEKGYWVKAKASSTVMTPAGSLVSPTVSKLLSGWNLVATGPTATPNTLKSSLGSALTSLWVWDNALSQWYFYAPSLDTGSGLADYAKANGYLDFSNAAKTVRNGDGFWLNMQ